MVCNNCNSCCEKTIIPLNVFDLAKILYKYENHKFQKDELSNWAGTIKIGCREVINIKYIPSRGPMAYIKADCYFLNPKGLCEIHDEKVNEDSILGRNLKHYNLPNSVKPKACRDYPEYYDNGEVYKFINCSVTDRTKANKVVNEEIIQESIITDLLDNALYEYYLENKTFPIVKTAHALINTDVVLEKLLNRVADLLIVTG